MFGGKRSSRKSRGGGSCGRKEPFQNGGRRRSRISRRSRGGGAHNHLKPKSHHGGLRGRGKVRPVLRMKSERGGRTAV